MKNIIILSMLALVVTLSGGCASIVTGQNQSLSVEARNDSGTVAKANCTLSNDKGTWFVLTPGTATVQRSYDDLNVTCEKDGMNPGVATAKSSTKGMAFGNILVGGFIGAGVDMATGAAYDYPSLISVRMGKAVSIAPPTNTAASAAYPLSIEEPTQAKEPAVAQRNTLRCSGAVCNLNR